MIPRKALLLPVAFLALGCGNSDGRIPLNGTVTYDGKPIPRGTIMFDPDTSQENTYGVQGSALIRDGKFETMSDFGPQKGAYVARVSGFDGKATPDLPDGEAICLNVRIPVVIESGQAVNLSVPKQEQEK